MTDIESVKVKIYRGYTTNFSLLEAGLFLSIDTATKVIRNETVFDVINRIYSDNPTMIKSEKRRLVENEIVGKMVMANYGKNAHYVI